jgi:hypothetical protein
MLRTFIDINGNIQYSPFGAYTNQINEIYRPVIINEPYPNSSLIVTPSYSNITTTTTTTPNTNNNTNKVVGYNVYSRPVFYTNNTISDVNNDPELRKNVLRYIYNKFVNAWLPVTFIKLQKYLKNSNGEITFIKTENEYDKHIINDDAKVNFIVDNIFSKHELLVFLDKFVNKYNLNWYDLKTKHIDRLKSELYDKLKNHMRKFVLRNL